MARVYQLAFLGDIMLGRGVNEEIKNRPPEYVWGDTLPLLKKADFVMANLECAITESTEKWQRTEKVFHFRADPSAVDVLLAGNVSCVNLANNHILDFEERGLTDTITYLQTAGIAFVGAGSDKCVAQSPTLVDIDGMVLGIIAATDNESEFAAGTGKPGANYLEIKTDENTLGFLAGEIKNLNELSDFSVFSLHWGPNMVLRPPEEHQEFARKMTDLGINLIHGHSAHNFQAVEKSQNGFILYDTGDFLDDYAVDPFFRNDWSFIFIVETKKKLAQKIRLIPVVLSYAQVNLARGEDFKLITEQMGRLCNKFGTKAKKTSEGLEIELQQ